MKTLTTLLFSIITLLSFADGGNGYGRKCNLQDLEPTFNLFYTSIDG